ncbi:MAG TPA: TolC family protein, partial [Thermoanaerobaculia bacterium]
MVSSRFVVHPGALKLTAALALAAAGCAAPVLAQGGAPEPTAPPPLTLAEATALAIAANPALAATRLGRGIAEANVDVAAERPNPDLILDRTRETPNEAVTLSLPVETAGKRRRRIDLARQGLDRGEAELARAEADLRNSV